MSDPLSARIADLFNQVHTLTNEFVSADVESSQLDATSRSVLQKLYSVLGIELGNVALANIDVGKVLDISNIVASEESHNDIVTSLVNYYLLLLVYSHLSRTFIARTIESLNQLSYWDGLHYSTSGKMLYFLQTSPARLMTTWSTYDPQRLRVDTQAHFSVEEDNSIYHAYEEMRDFVLRAVESVKAAIHKVSPSMILEKQLGPMNMISAVYHIPYSVASKDVRRNRRDIRHRMDSYARTIGELLNTIPQENPQSISDINIEKLLGTAESILDITERDGSGAKRINTVLRQLGEFEKECHTKSTAPPGFYTRWWPGLALAINFGPAAAFKAYHNWRDILQWFRLNFVETVVGFWNNWVIKPISNMMSVLRHDDGSDLSITTKESLQSDLDLLERMVVDYVVDYEKKDGAQVQQEIHQAITNGNLTMLMLRYEQDLRSPFKAVLKGSLVRALLIQIQKTKVDGAVAISGIDKLLKSQQLVFGVVSISPSLVILYQGYQALRRMRSRPVRLHGKQVNILCLKLLNSIEKWLRSTKDSELISGHVFLEVIRLLLWTDNVIPRQLQEEWRRDLHELALGGGRDTMDRVWRMYEPYFR